jgi:hypothetical protein
MKLEYETEPCRDITVTSYVVNVLGIGQPTYEKVNEELFLDNPLRDIVNKSKLAYRIYVILIANKELIKKSSRRSLCTLSRSRRKTSQQHAELTVWPVRTNSL